MDNKRLEKIPTQYRKNVERKLRLISEAVQKKRESLDLTQEELAERLDVSVMTIQFIEQSRRYPSLPMLFYICESLSIQIKIGS